MDLSLTKKEFDMIGQQTFVDWAYKHLANNLQDENELYDIVCEYHIIKDVIVIYFMRYLNKYAFEFYLTAEYPIYNNDNKWTIHSNNNNNILTNSFNRFIEIEKTKLILKPYYEEDIVKEVEELFF